MSNICTSTKGQKGNAREFREGEGAEGGGGERVRSFNRGENVLRA